MARHQGATFQDVLEIVETLPDYQQESLVDIIHKRLIDRKREALVEIGTHDEVY
ncbi:hypothetical protein GF339_00135 [candidate division KSB3 bacterium]|uniref:Uncharacterized protein n=1 Tax=candidate division KSB3 bacterium TaxID=2044937 RepID=A0A9D5JS36_9BACT|nr:hypothetical protein [candidate division KSB3 bacterium]MBD3322956.1 hypothetical protein [candidate division KSB3 bacterium]